MITDSLEKAHKLVKRAELTSNLESGDDETVEARQRNKPGRFIESMTEYDDGKYLNVQIIIM